MEKDEGSPTWPGEGIDWPEDEAEFDYENHPEIVEWLWQHGTPVNVLPVRHRPTKDERNRGATATRLDEE